jgi:hypothetical protein
MVGPGHHRLIQLLLKFQHRDGLGLLPFVPVGVSYLPGQWGYRVEVKLGPALYAVRPRQAQDLTYGIMTQISHLSGF